MISKPSHFKTFLQPALFVIIALSLIISTPTFALSQDIIDFLNKNGIFYYDPDGYLKSNNCYPGLGSYDGTVTAGLSALQAAFVDTYHDLDAALSSEYGIPWEAVMAQGILESSSGTSRYARERNNFFGLGAVDSNPNNAYYYNTPADGWKGYFEFIDGNPRYRKNGAFDHPNDPIGYLQAIKNAGYATSPSYVENLAPLVKAIQNRAKEKGWPTSDEVSSPGTTPNGDYMSCAGDTIGNGNLNATALALSWPDRTHAIDDPKEAYRQALSAVGLSSYPDKYVQIGASCDAFIATVLRFSGVDPGAVCCGAVNLLNYFISHPNLYEEIANTDNQSDLQPGDIRATPSHVEMYVVDESGTGRIASASHGDRTADHARGFYPNSSARIFRFKGSSTN